VEHCSDTGGTEGGGGLAGTGTRGSVGWVDPCSGVVGAWLVQVVDE
jgi:hypothetical protein